MVNFLRDNLDIAPHHRAVSLAAIIIKSGSCEGKSNRCVTVALVGLARFRAFFSEGMPTAGCNTYGLAHFHFKAGWGVVRKGIHRDGDGSGITGMVRIIKICFGTIGPSGRAGGRRNTRTIHAGIISRAGVIAASTVVGIGLNIDAVGSAESR